MAGSFWLKAQQVERGQSYLRYSATVYHYHGLNHHIKAWMHLRARTVPIVCKPHVIKWIQRKVSVVGAEQSHCYDGYFSLCPFTLQGQQHFLQTIGFYILDTDVQALCSSNCNSSLVHSLWIAVSVSRWNLWSPMETFVCCKECLRNIFWKVHND